MCNSLWYTYTYTPIKIKILELWCSHKIYITSEYFREPLYIRSDRLGSYNFKEGRSFFSPRFYYSMSYQPDCQR